MRWLVIAFLVCSAACGGTVDPIQDAAADVSEAGEAGEAGTDAGPDACGLTCSIAVGQIDTCTGIPKPWCEGCVACGYDCSVCGDGGTDQ